MQSEIKSLEKESLLVDANWTEVLVDKDPVAIGNIVALFKCLLIYL